MSFGARLALSFAAMALIAILQGVVSFRIADEAERQVVRGRVAGDLQSGFLELSATKQRLRAWSLRALIGAQHEPGDGEMLRLRMESTIERLKALSHRARDLDTAAGRDPAENQRRSEALDLLSASVFALKPAIQNISGQNDAQNALMAWQSIEAIFDLGAGRDLREVLNSTIETEAAVLARERAEADNALARQKLISAVATAILVVFAALLAVYFARALRQPLARLTAGVNAFERGDLDHRIPGSGRDEFARFGHSFNRMAHELAERRDQEAGLRASLERDVEARTAELESALEGLRQAELRRRQLLGDISHELKTPMTAIRGEAEIALRGEKSAADFRASLHRIGEASRHMGALIDDLLMMARSDAEALALDMQLVDPAESLRTAVDSAAVAASERGVSVLAAPGPACEVRADASRLRQVIALLLDNAIRYSRPGGAVRIDATVEGQAPAAAWVLKITDSGIGIPAADLPFVFERTFRAANARTHRPDGTGLGLAIARTLTERQGGSLTLTSELGMGTEVRLSLPVHPASEYRAEEHTA